MPGEIAEMMLNGDMCEGCGEWLGGEGDGFPRYCSAECARGRGVMECEPIQATKDKSRSKKFGCPQCGRRFHKELAVADHLRDKHQVKPHLAARNKSGKF